MSGWSIVATMVSGMAAMVGALVILNLRSLSACIKEIKGRQDTHDGQMRKLGEKFAACKVDCDRNTVSKEDWVRSEGYTRQAMGRLSDQLSRMDGKLSVVEKLPDICGAIARQVGEQIKDARP